MAKRTAKVVLIGDGAVGKTSLVRRFVDKRFDDSYITTIGTNVKKKKIEDLDVNLLIWDLYGQKLNTDLQKANFKGANGAIVVYDLTRESTFKSVDDWLEELFEVTGEIPFIVLGNKYDLLEEFLIEVGLDDVSEERFEEFVKRHHVEVLDYYKKVYQEIPEFKAVPIDRLKEWGENKEDELDVDFSYYKSSAKTGENVEKAFREIAEYILRGG